MWPSPVTTYFVRGQLGQAHRAAGVQLLGRDADLRAEAELAAVGEPGRRVDHAPPPRPPVPRTPRAAACELGHDRLGVPGAVPSDVARPRRPVMSHDRRRDVRGQVLGARSPRRSPARPSGADRRRPPPGRRARSRPAARRAGSASGRNASATAACTSSDSAVLQTDGRWVLALSSDRQRLVQVGRLVDVHVAVARRRSRSPARWTPRPPSGSATAPPRGISTSTRPRARISSLTESRVVASSSWIASAGRPADGDRRRAAPSTIAALDCARRRRAAQQHRVARLQADAGGVRGHVRPGLVDDADHAERHPDLPQLQAVGQGRAADHLADRVGQRGHLAQPVGHRRRPALGVSESRSIRCGRRVAGRGPGRRPRALAARISAVRATSASAIARSAASLAARVAVASSVGGDPGPSAPARRRSCQYLRQELITAGPGRRGGRPPFVRRARAPRRVPRWSGRAGRAARPRRS